MSITKRDLFNVWYAEKNPKKKSDAVVLYIFIENDMHSEENDDFKNKVKQAARNFVTKLSKKWMQAHRTKTVFESTNKCWLDEIFLIPSKASSMFLEKYLEDGPSTAKHGRPFKPFSEGGQRSKQAKTKSLVNTCSPCN